MTLPFALPDWLPWWVPILLLVPALLYALLFLVMPFNVFGVKGRLDTLEVRLDEIQGEIRSLALRLPEPLRHSGYDDDPYVGPVSERPPPPAQAYASGRPPIPPAPPEIEIDPTEAPYGRPARAPARRDPARPEHGRPARAEPRLDPR